MGPLFLGGNLPGEMVGHCLLKKSEQDSALKQDYSSAFELD
jgi:carbamoyltransferase